MSKIRCLFPVTEFSRGKREMPKPLLSLIIWLFQLIILLFKRNNFPVFPLLKLEMEMRGYDYPLVGKIGKNDGWFR